MKQQFPEAKKSARSEQSRFERAREELVLKDNPGGHHFAIVIVFPGVTVPVDQYNWQNYLPAPILRI